MRRKIPPEELHGQEVGYHFPGSDDELQLFEVRCDPDVTFNSHAHDEDEIMYVLSGEITSAGGATRRAARLHPGQDPVLVPLRPRRPAVPELPAAKDATYITRDEMQQQRTAERETR